MTISAAKEKAVRRINNISPTRTITPKKSKGLSAFFRSIFKPSTKDAAWTNWAKNQSCNPTEIFHPKTLQDLTAIVLKAKATGKKIRCAGSGHSWSSSSVTDGYLVDVNGMQQIHAPVYDSTRKTWTVTIETGVLAKDLDDALRKHDPPLAMPSNTVIDSVSTMPILCFFFQLLSIELSSDDNMFYCCMCC